MSRIMYFKLSSILFRWLSVALGKQSVWLWTSVQIILAGLVAFAKMEAGTVLVLKVSRVQNAPKM